MIPMEFTKRYYGISEAASMFGLKTSTLRFWEKEFLELQPKKAESGARKYSVKDMEKLSQIHHLVKERGFTLDGAKKEIGRLRKKKKEKQEVVERLKKLRGFLEELSEKG